MSQLKTKFIEDNAVTGTKVRLSNNETLRARNAANSADVDLLKLNSSDELELLSLPQAAAALPMPSTDKQFATIEWVNNYIKGKTDAKDAVNVVADANIALTGTTTLVIDGITVADGMRVGLVGQTDATQNGIYDAAIAGANWTLTRSSDFDQVDDAGGSEVTQGAYFRVIQGTEYGGYEFILTTADPITLGTTSLTFAGYPTAASITGGDMIVKTGDDFAVDLASNGGLESTNPGNAAGQLRVKTRTGDAEKDQTVKIDSSGNVVGKKPYKQLFTLTSTDITNQYVDLPDVAAQNSVGLAPVGAGYQYEGIDFTVNYTGGTSSKTRVTFAGGLATGGVSALAAGDVIVVPYMAY